MEHLQQHLWEYVFLSPLNCHNSVGHCQRWPSTHTTHSDTIYVLLGNTLFAMRSIDTQTSFSTLCQMFAWMSTTYVMKPRQVRDLYIIDEVTVRAIDTTSMQKHCCWTSCKCRVFVDGQMLNQGMVSPPILILTERESLFWIVIIFALWCGWSVRQDNYLLLTWYNTRVRDLGFNLWQTSHRLLGKLLYCIDV